MIRYTYTFTIIFTLFFFFSQIFFLELVACQSKLFKNFPFQGSLGYKVLIFCCIFIFEKQLYLMHNSIRLRFPTIFWLLHYLNPIDDLEKPTLTPIIFLYSLFMSIFKVFYTFYCMTTKILGVNTRSSTIL